MNPKFCNENPKTFPLAEMIAPITQILFKLRIF